MTHPLVLKYSLSAQDIEQQVNSIVGDYNLDELVERTTNTNSSRLVKGTVLEIKNDFVVVDLGGKYDGRLRYSEENNCEDLDIGDEAHFVVSKVDKSGTKILSRKNIDKILQRRKALESLSVGAKIEGLLYRRTNLGWLIELKGLFALLPYQEEFIFYGEEEPESFKGKTISAHVKSIDNEIVILTREHYAKEIKKQKKSRSLAPFTVGKIVSGTIKNMTAFGAFIQIPGSIIGLCHISDFGTYSLSIGQTVACRVL